MLAPWHASVLVVDCNLTEEALKWLFQHARNIPIFVDTVSSSKAPRIRHWLSHIHTLKPNRTEAETLSGVKIKTQKDAADAALWFHRHGVQRLILSMDAEGVYYSELDSISGYSPAIHTNVINANGAGDVMMAGLVHCWLEGRELQESVLFAQQCSALTLSSEDIDLSPQNHSYL